MIQDPSKDITFIVYNTPKPPRYIKLNKRLIKLLIFLIPLIVALSIAFSLLSSVYMKRKLEKSKSKEPELILQLRSDKEALQTEMQILKETNTTLTTKISAGVSSTDSPLNNMALFTTPLGFQDRRKENLTKLENMNNDLVNKKILFKFDLINNRQDEAKVSGYINIIQYHSDGISFYPAYELSVDAPRLQFSRGESFTVSRFRPVIAEFPRPKGSNVWYKVFIFSRTGDLLAFKKAGPFQVQ